MEQIFQKLREIATATYPLEELADSPSPGERHAVRALRFAVGSVDPSGYPQLAEAIGSAEIALKSAGAGSDSDGRTVLLRAKENFKNLPRRCPPRLKSMTD